MTVMTLLSQHQRQSELSHLTLGSWQHSQNPTVFAAYAKIALGVCSFKPHS